jgi:hypothetical protein
MFRAVNFLADRLLNLLIISASCGHCSKAQQDKQPHNECKSAFPYGRHPHWNSGQHGVNRLVK